MTGLKLMYFWLMKSGESVDFKIWIREISSKSVDSWDFIRICEFQWNPQSSLRPEQGNIVTKKHLATKVTSCISLGQIPELSTGRCLFRILCQYMIILFLEKKKMLATFCYWEQIYYGKNGTSHCTSVWNFPNVLFMYPNFSYSPQLFWCVVKKENFIYQTWQGMVIWKSDHNLLDIHGLVKQHGRISIGLIFGTEMEPVSWSLHQTSCHKITGQNICLYHKIMHIVTWVKI